MSVTKSTFNQIISPMWVLVALSVLCGFSWYFLVIVGDLGGGEPTVLASVENKTIEPLSLADFPMIFLMWAIMMIAMMLPSALMMVHLFSKVNGRKTGAHNSSNLMILFSVGYILVCIAFSLIAAGIQWLLQITALLSPMMALTSVFLSATVLVAAGIYQWTPLKQSCLSTCRSPMTFLLLHWQGGPKGALQMGLKHGIYCVGCCWLLMMIMFVGGVMGIYWMIGITVYVLLEKIIPRGELLSRVGGVAMALGGVFWLSQI